MVKNKQNSLKEIAPLKKRILVGLALLTNKNGDGNYQSLFYLHKITKVPLDKIKTILKELHADGLITLHSHNTNLNEAA